MLVYLAADEARLEELDTAARDYLGWTHVLANEADLDLTQNQKNQAAQRQTQADQTVTARLLQTFTWALVPAQPDPGAPFVIKETKVEGQSDSLADRVSRRLGNDGDLSTRQAAATIRLAIGKVPQIWKDGHVSLGALWGLYCAVPVHAAAARPARARRGHRRPADDLADRRLRPRDWLRRGRRPLHRALDSGGQGRCAGRDRLAPARASRRRAEAARSRGPTPATDPERPSPTADVRSPVRPTRRRRSTFVKAKTRFYGVKTLNSDKIALDFKNIADEVLAHLRRRRAPSVTVRIEIEATDTTGFDESKVRTVSENARTLKFDQSGFEES